MDNRVELVRANDKANSGTAPGKLLDDLVPAGRWLLRQKVMLPDPVEGFVERTALGARCDPLRWRMTAINAPGGFGKTTLLAEACRRSRKLGTVVAWLTVDEEDGPATLATYLAFAFSEAGLDILDPRAVSRDFEGRDYRINLLLNSIDAHGADCVLALDDVHRLRDPESLEIVNRLLQHAPANLHLALAFRYIPDGLDVATPVFSGRGMTIATDELRFQKPEIARFFATTLSRSELARLTESSQGWPIALCIHRNVGEQTAPDVLAHDIASNWIETRLWTGLSDDDQDFILDIGLFEWINADLVDDVLGVGSVRRIGSIPALSDCCGRWGTIRERCICIRSSASTAPTGDSMKHRIATARSIGLSPSCWRAKATWLLECAMPRKRASRDWSARYSKVPAAFGCGSSMAWFASGRRAN
ncbi:MAG: hypothetical protein OXH68_03750 [Gammaproteobacteria bacterium]|nr:hypothetical protein [Gammaproteobacteria bacterium]